MKARRGGVADLFGQLLNLLSCTGTPNTSYIDLRRNPYQDSKTR